MLLLIRLSLQTLSVSNLPCTDLKSISNLAKVCPHSARNVFINLIFQACLTGFYKSVASNSKCNECLTNSASNTGRTGCLCHEGFYKKPGLHVAPCKGNRRSRVLKFYLLFTQNVSPFLIGPNPPALSS